MNAAFTCAMICLNAACRLWHGFAAKENAIRQNCHIALIYGGMMGVYGGMMEVYGGMMGAQ
ncbi:MAG: hypothetical protein P8N71_05985 [Alphaproteobacteria bacterium]|jgi:hypothetical protein|nr:hypothetical protein [Alphaproteobacteria bacterium]